MELFTVYIPERFHAVITKPGVHREDLSERVVEVANDPEKFEVEFSAQGDTQMKPYELQLDVGDRTHLVSRFTEMVEETELMYRDVHTCVVGAALHSMLD